MIEIVPDQLIQVFINILINALDAIKGEGIIKVNSNFDEENIYINIADDGTGMEKEIQDKIFDPFFTTKQVGKGTGLGLSVSYGIIKRFNGEISVDSKIGEGSEFIIQIPYLIENKGK
jgi:signal transduction histidine kinase